jgi:hypothetical protein
MRKEPISKEELAQIKVGYTLERAISGVIPMDVIVGKIDDKLIYCGSADGFISWDQGWKFSKANGYEVDDDLGWDGTTVTGTYLTKILAESAIKVSDTEKSRRLDSLKIMAEAVDKETNSSHGSEMLEQMIENMMSSDPKDSDGYDDQESTDVDCDCPEDMDANNPSDKIDGFTADSSDPSGTEMEFDEAMELLGDMVDSMMKNADKASKKSKEAKAFDEEVEKTKKDLSELLKPSSKSDLVSDILNEYNIKFETTNGNYPGVKGGMTVGTITYWISIHGSPWKKLSVFYPGELRAMLPICKKEVQVGHLIATATQLPMTMKDGKFIFLEIPDDKRIVEDRVVKRT